MGFDEAEFESLYFQGVNFDDARNILIDEEKGVFLIRDSSRGGYVLCVREDSDVNQYPIVVKESDDHNHTIFFIREDCPFHSLTSLLSFYKRNILTSTALKRPVATDRVTLRRGTREGSESRGYVKSEIPSGHVSAHVNAMRRSAPPDMSASLRTPEHSELPARYARVLKPREPSPYTRDLHLKVGDIVRVTGRSMKAGMGRGELNGQVGEFPLVNVEFIDMNKTPE